MSIGPSQLLWMCSAGVLDGVASRSSIIAEHAICSQRMFNFALNFHDSRIPLIIPALFLQSPSMPSTPSQRRTRASNALKHPGHIVAPTPRRTSAQVKEDKKREELQKERQASKRKRALEAIAEEEVQMQDEDELAKANHAVKHIGTGSAVHSVLKKKAKQSASKKTGKGGHDEPYESDLTELPSEDELPKKKAKKDSSTRVTIEQARLELVNRKATEPGDIRSKEKLVVDPGARLKSSTVAHGRQRIRVDSPKHDHVHVATFGHPSAHQTSKVTPHSSRYLGRGPIQDKGFASESDEDVERIAAMSSPVKAPVMRATHQNMVKINDIDNIDVTPFAKPSLYKSVINHGVIDVEDTPHPIRDRTTANTYVKVDDMRRAAHANLIVVKREPSNIIRRELFSTTKASQSRRPTGKSKTSDLPAGANDNGRWQHVFVLTLRRYAGTLVNPWIIKDDEFIEALQLIWNAIYGNKVPHQVACNDHVFKLATQRLSEWRSSFGSTALRILENFFIGDKENSYDNVEDRCEFTEYMLSKLRFTYEHAVGDNKKEWRGLYQSMFILRLVASHFTLTKGAVSVPGLAGMEEDKECPIGAIAMASAATYRALFLWVNNDMTLENGKAIMLKGLNVATGDATNSETAFSEVKYRVDTIGYAKAAQKLASTKPKKMGCIIERAMKIARAGKSITRREVINVDASELDSDEDPSKLVELGSDTDGE
ncbi:uncharacterized protein LAESUDRAFT_750170 [Laetiporus sulphureus 93-53]|uniref:DUF6532 domain-containing protein n=1 Tax=Laetiporus sulphureus 93-53 TaxID=1314785 RepID=A0A165E7H3_9APHY|nr:uncharacterized protein LAESUDRAFT_750170 [Laetiporus sulphureus 93-53]KZT06390.1 hypothetical protein LAESUDRAFT_750170 [Laetiporus sulphureus 93-53]